MTMTDLKYPNVKVKLTGKDGNAFMILGLVQRAMRKAKLTKDQIDEYMKEATSGDYNNLLCVTCRYVDAR